jgi:membrane-bound serine protease (ClpP class)
MVFQGRMNRKIYRIVLWVIIILVIISFLMTIVVPLVAATLPSDASPAAATPSPVEKGLFKALTDWLVQPLVSGFLIAVGMSGLAMELFALTWGRPGTVGFISLALFFSGSYLSGIAGVWAVALFVLGIVLIVSEVLVFPGRLAAGLGGAVLLIAAVILASPSTALAAVYLVVGFLTTVVVLLCDFRVIDLKAIWKRIRHGRPVDKRPSL